MRPKVWSLLSVLTTFGIDQTRNPNSVGHSFMTKNSVEMDLGDLKQTALGACQYFMRPIARLLLRMGISYKEFAEAAKISFVDVASADYGLRGRPTNISRVAVMTGLTRKEVKKLRDLIADQEISEAFKSRLGPCSVITHFWHHDPDYQDDSGRPRSLPIEGEFPSFATLVRKYGGDIPSGAMLKELLRTGVAEMEGEDHLRAKTEFVIPAEVDADKFVSVSYSLSNLAYTLAHNVTTGNAERPLFERFLWTDRLKAEHQIEFEKIASSKAKDLLRSLDKWVSERELPEPNLSSKSEGERTKNIGLGIYLFDNDVSRKPFY